MSNYPIVYKGVREKLTIEEAARVCQYATETKVEWMPRVRMYLVTFRGADGLEYGHILTADNSVDALSTLSAAIYNRAHETGY